MPFCRGRYEQSAYQNKRRRLDDYVHDHDQYPARYLAMARRAVEQMEEEEEEDHMWQTETATASAYPEETSTSFEPNHARVEHPEQVVRTSSREELMECIKRGQRPQWVPNPGLQALQAEEEARCAQRRASGALQTSIEASTFTSRFQQKSLSVDPALDAQSQEPYERPGSALHRGNFAETIDGLDESVPFASQPGLAISTTQAVPSLFEGSQIGSPRPTANGFSMKSRSLGRLNTNMSSRRRAPSLGSSLSSSFVMRTPTSPLVFATSHGDLQDNIAEPRSAIESRDNSRRRTMPPNSLQSYSFLPLDEATPNFSRPLPATMRGEHSLPLQGHTPRRSLSSFTYHPRASPLPSFSPNRRLSGVSDIGQRRRTSMVGSFEESILRGRMSSPASKPFDFNAQIGVMGKGDCPTHLKCPAHVTVPFPAVFYNYPATAEHASPANNSPSPYVGTIDLKNNLREVTLSNAKKQKATKPNFNDKGISDPQNDTLQLAAEESVSKLHVGGAYRVPRQGQLQIIIKNPNKTAVKLFLVPYDLQGMTPGTKSFVRQRSYSTGPIIDNVLTEDSAKTVLHDPLQNKHILRYLIHIRFCCPAKDRFYLYDDIRVVFANRVPDGEEKLHNEIQLPEPKFSTWKPFMPATAPHQPVELSTTPSGNMAGIFGDMEDLHKVESPNTSPVRSKFRHDLAAFDFSSTATSHTSRYRFEQKSPSPQPTVSPAFASPKIDQQSWLNEDSSSTQRSVSPVMGFGHSTPLRGSPVPWRSASNTPSRTFSPVPQEVRDGLLSKQFKELLRTSTNGSTTRQRPDSSAS